MSSHRREARASSLELVHHEGVLDRVRCSSLSAAFASAALARYLAGATSVDDGRTYAGGLTKFEPREMERLLVPVPA